MAAHMRDRKAARARVRRQSETQAALRADLDKLRARGCLRGRGKIVPSRVAGVLGLHAPGDGGAARVMAPWSSMAGICFSKIQRRNDVSRTFSFGARTLSQMQVLGAACLASNDAAFWA